MSSRYVIPENQMYIRYVDKRLIQHQSYIQQAEKITHSLLFVNQLKNYFQSTTFLVKKVYSIYIHYFVASQPVIQIH